MSNTSITKFRIIILWLRHAIKYKANWALLHDEVRILIFDDPAENEGGNVPQGRVNCQTRVGRAARAACMEKIYEIPCAWAAWDLCAGSLLVKSTVLLLSVFWCNLVDPCILKTNRSKFTSNLNPVYGDACSAKSFGVRASRSWSYEIWLSIVWRLGWSWCSKAGEWTAKLFCIANHSAASQLFVDRISAPCPWHAVAPRRAQKRPLRGNTGCVIVLKVAGKFGSDHL